MKKICVYGSISADMTISIDQFPSLGENVVGSKYNIGPGGKGANQAVACAKLGANVQLISMIGYDEMGVNMMEKVRRCGVGVRYVGRFPIKTTLSIIAQGESGKQSMIFFSECNSKLTVAHLEKCYEAIDNAGILMLQLSVPIDGVVAAAKRMKENAGGVVILDPSPATPLEDEFLRQLDIITPNEKELAVLSGMSDVGSGDKARLAAAQSLIERGVACVVNKAGACGAYIVDQAGMRHIPPFDVQGQSTLGVGSAFNGGLAVGLARGMDIDAAVRFGCAASALTIANGGSQSAMPAYDECLDLINGRYSFEQR